jgi:hypothetical protein
MPIRINTAPRCTAAAPVAPLILTENTMARVIAAIANVPPAGPRECAPVRARVFDDMRPLRNDSVDAYPRASDYVDQVISQIERLQQAGATAGGIYFDLTPFPHSGQPRAVRTSCAATRSRGWTPIPTA